MNYLIALLVGLAVGALYALLGVRSPAPPAVALIGLQLGERLWPLGRDLAGRWLQ